MIWIVVAFALAYLGKRRRDAWRRQRVLAGLGGELPVTLRFWWVSRAERLQAYRLFDDDVCAKLVRTTGRTLYFGRRWLEGARRVRTARDSRGELSEETLEIEWGGQCPVQGHGLLDGREIYYRSRGEGWSLQVAPPGGDVWDDSAWIFGRQEYFFPDGGWVHPDVTAACIREAVAHWRARDGATAATAR